ncbi:hypothetical protein AHF37_01592 [Paragonimus kellicotti]|nr:hypothetical protein AHF37_01592 [Paragonimus kellicotti]
MKLEEFVEVYASLANSQYFKPKNIEDVDQLVLSCRLPLEKQLMELKQLVSTSAANTGSVVLRASTVTCRVRSTGADHAHDGV